MADMDLEEGRKRALDMLKELKEKANKKHTFQKDAGKKLDYFCAYLQLKAIIVHEHQYDTEELLDFVEQYSWISPK